MEQIKDYKAILADENLVLDIIREDLHEMKDKFGDARRTEIVGDIEDFDIEDLIAEENVAVVISHEGYIKRMPLSTYRRQNRGGKGITGADTKEGDFVEHLFIASTHDYILFFTDQGKVLLAEGLRHPADVPDRQGPRHRQPPRAGPGREASRR